MLFLKGILSTSCVIFSYPNLLSISVLTFIKWRLNTELLMNTLRNVVFSTKKADHRYSDKHLVVLSKRIFDTQSIHIFGLVYYLSTSQNSPFYIRCYTYGKRSFVLFSLFQEYDWQK
jgi:hypothetical protein